MLNNQDKQNYVLKLFDDDLMTFSLFIDRFHELKAEIKSLNEELKTLLPVGLETTEEGILKWLRRRVIPKRRAHSDMLMYMYGIRGDDISEIIEVSRLLSLNDSYWVTYQGSVESFSDVELYDSSFPEGVAETAFFGMTEKPADGKLSPEMTTGGTLRKAWRRTEQGEIFLYKGGTEGAECFGNEPFSEYYASQIAQRMGLNAVNYDLKEWNGSTASVCRLFTDIDTSFVPAGRIVRHATLKDCIDLYESFSEDALEQLKDMIVFDAVIYNEDRHFGNFGLLRDSRTGELISAAPVFDNGYSLFCMATDEQMKSITRYAEYRSNPYRIPYNTICEYMIGSRQRGMLQKLIDFSFKRHPVLDLSEERLNAIERQIQLRVRELLSL
ncbi:MAG: HipA domain-containing protein [Oscillospiraceae bacterium]|nr:HipA domain-containing protein [Oscillospiraceae bacterium]